MRNFLTLMFLALLLIGLSAFVNPDRLLTLGLYDYSLTHPNDLVRSIARLEILFFRICFLVSGIALFLVAIFWNKIVQSHWGGLILSANPKYPNSLTSVFNFSLVVMLGAYFLGVLYAAIGGTLLTDEILRLINKEDGIIEQATVFGFLVAGAVSCLVAVRAKDCKGRRIFHALFAMLFFVAAGEELSWGQRIFDLPTVEVLKGLNVQNENNLHNLLGYASNHMYMLVILFYSVFLPILRTLHRFWDKLFSVIGCPLPSPGLAVGFCVVSLGGHDWFVYQLIPATAGLAFTEMYEFLTAVGLVLLMIESSLTLSRKVGRETTLAIP